VSAIDGLADALERLPLLIEHTDVVFSRVPVATYPDGRRPSSTLTISGAGESGHGEHVGWTDDEHAALGNSVAGIAKGSFRVGQWARTLDGLPSYDRAALEAAAIDLALHQNRTNLFRLCGAAPRPVRYAISFAAVADPLAEAASLRTGGLALKIDVDPRWKDDTWRALAALGTVAVVDFKLGGEASDHERACRHLPDAWIEDPKPGGTAWSPAVLARLSADAAVTSASALSALTPRPAAVNIKPARIGSVLEALACITLARAMQLEVYIGGMFEVGVGRRQLAVLAALACPDAANDIAPVVDEAPRAPRVGEAPRPPRLAVPGDVSGFAASTSA
jgi:L-alanine-DL-glutamate epimerase-like enolase superfamily enzyme